MSNDETRQNTSLKTEARFVSESIVPEASTANTGAMASGEPGLPTRFKWGDENLQIAGVIKSWKESGPCTHGSEERYIKKHWFEVRTESHGFAKIYFERQARGKNRKERWWLYSLENVRA